MTERAPAPPRLMTRGVTGTQHEVVVKRESNDEVLNRIITRHHHGGKRSGRSNTRRCVPICFCSARIASVVMDTIRFLPKDNEARWRACDLYVESLRCVQNEIRALTAEVSP